MRGKSGKLNWEGFRSWLLNGWRNRTARFVTILTLVLGLIGSELPFEPYDWAQKLLTARINAKPYRGDSVIVGIDARTMEALGKTRLSDDDLALLINKIAAAKPKQIVIGRIREHVYGPTTSPLLIAAVKRVSPKPIMFVEMAPKNRQEVSWEELSRQGTDSDLFPQKIDKVLIDLVEPAIEITKRNAFGAPWGLPPTIQSAGRSYPSIAQLLADQEQKILPKYEIDMSYNPSSIPLLNAVDVLEGRDYQKRIENKKIIIYSTSNSINLSDPIKTPFGIFPSQAPISILGAQTLIDGPPIMLGWLPSYFLAVLGIIAWFNINYRHRRWIVFGIFLTILLAPVLLERHLIFQNTSNALFLLGFVALARQWSKFRATLQLARSAADTKSWFLAQASHDLRQPIHAIGMLTARLAQTDLSPMQAELASKIDRSIEGANRMLQSLLDLATIESGSLKPKLAPIAVNALLSEIEEQSALAAERAGVTLRFVPSEAVIVTDRSLAAAMLQNIVSNAIKYATGKQVLVGARRTGKHLSLCAYDVGAGISNEDMRHVQTAFFRVAKHAKGGVEGTGLGLAIVHRLASLLGLTFTLKSRPGKGTSAIIGGFRLTDSRQASASDTQASGMRPLTGLRVLLSDDDLESLRATEALLEQWGCKVAAHEAFPDVQEEIDIILSDFDFGKGHTLADHRHTVEKLASVGVPTIVMSGHHPDFVKSAMKRDTLLVLEKPVRPAELRAVLMASKSQASR
jgi:signal transduction histidine kinase